MLGRILHMVVCKRCHEVVAVIIVFLESEVDTFVVSGLLGGLDEILRKQLLLLVEVVASSLPRISTRGDAIESTVSTHHIDEHLQRSFPLLY
jgi:hypothetical protein